MIVFKWDDLPSNGMILLIMGRLLSKWDNSPYGWISLFKVG